MTDPHETDVPEVTPLELVRALEAGDPLQVVDVRLPARVGAGRIDLVPQERFHNVVGSQLRARTDLAATGLTPGLRTVVTCGRGNDSRLAAAHLRSLGLEAFSLRGGMAAWMDALVERPVAPPPGLDSLTQFDRVGKGSLAYLLVSGGEAVVVDPPRDAHAIVDAAKGAHARIVGVADTHVHADYVSGAPALSSALGVPYYLNALDNSFPYYDTPGRLAITPIVDGTTLRVGRATLVARHNPGHTLGSTSFVVDGALALSGDFVFVESLGRPDLAGRADAWAPLLWESLERARREWARELLVLPGHYSHARERRADHCVAGVFGELLTSNAALRFTDRAAFLEWAATRTSVPENYRAIKSINTGLRIVTDAQVTELEVGRNEGAVARPPA